MFTKALVPLDGSELAETALPYAVALCRGMDMEVVLVHVVPANESIYSDGKAGGQGVRGTRADGPLTHRGCARIGGGTQTCMKRAGPKQSTLEM